jgi:hypothetical protein
LCGMVWCGVVRRGVARRGVMWCGVALCRVAADAWIDWFHLIVCWAFHWVGEVVGRFSGFSTT